MPSLSLAKMESESRRQMNDGAECGARKEVGRSQSQADEDKCGGAACSSAQSVRAIFHALNTRDLECEG